MPNDTTASRAASREGARRDAGNVMAYIRWFMRRLRTFDARMRRD